jgi:hypothetical protein
LQDVKERCDFIDSLRFEPNGILETEVKWLPIAADKNDYIKSRDHVLLQIYIESARNVGASEIFAEVTISPFVDKKHTSTAQVRDGEGSWEKYFNFFIKNPLSDVLTVRVFDKISLACIGFFNYQIKDIFMRKSMEHELQAFPLTSSSNSEIIMAMKLNILKD